VNYWILHIFFILYPYSLSEGRKISDFKEEGNMMMGRSFGFVPNGCGLIPEGYEKIKK
jgi:hypothetical protein